MDRFQYSGKTDIIAPRPDIVLPWDRDVCAAHRRFGPLTTPERLPHRDNQPCPAIGDAGRFSHFSAKDQTWLVTLVVGVLCLAPEEVPIDARTTVLPFGAL